MADPFKKSLQHSLLLACMFACACLPSACTRGEAEAVGPGKTPPPPTLVCVEESLGKVPDACSNTAATLNLSWPEIEARHRLWSSCYALSPDQRRIAAVRSRGNQVALVVDGVEGAPYDEIRHVSFSPDSRRVGFVCIRGNQMSVVVDGVESPPSEKYPETYPIFSPDSRHLAYLAKSAAGVHAVIDGKIGPAFHSIRRDPPPIVFSPDSKRHVYVAQTSDLKWHLVVDGQVSGEAVEHVHGFPLFSPDSRRIAITVGRGHDNFALIDGIPGPAFTSVSKLCFSPDGQRTAYEGWTEDMQAKYVIDGVPSEPCGYDIPQPIVFSPDSKHVAYVAGKGDKWHVVLDGVAGPAYDSIRETPLFSPCSTHFAYAAERGYKFYLNLDGKEGTAAIDIRRLTFSPDGKHFAYFAENTWYTTVVLDGKEGPRHIPTDLYASQPRIIFSPDSQRMAYHLGLLRCARVVVDGIEGPLHEKVEHLGIEFSADSKHLVYSAGGYDRDHIHVDGLESTSFDELCYQSWPVFGADGKVHALVIKGDEVLRLSITPPGDTTHAAAPKPGEYRPTLLRDLKLSALSFPVKTRGCWLEAGAPVLALP